MTDPNTENQSGGVNFFGGTPDIKGDVVGRDKTVNYAPSPELEAALSPIREAVRTAPEDKRAEAEATVEELKRETTKGKDANDSMIAKLVDGLVDLVPGAVSAVVSAFGTPILGGIAGPVTKFALGRIQEK